MKTKKQNDNEQTKESFWKSYLGRRRGAPGRRGQPIPAPSEEGAALDEPREGITLLGEAEAAATSYRMNKISTRAMMKPRSHPPPRRKSQRCLRRWKLWKKRKRARRTLHWERSQLQHQGVVGATILKPSGNIRRRRKFFFTSRYRKFETWGCKLPSRRKIEAAFLVWVSHSLILWLPLNSRRCGKSACTHQTRSTTRRKMALVRNEDNRLRTIQTSIPHQVLFSTWRFPLERKESMERH